MSTTNPLTASKQEADDEPMVMVSLHGHGDEEGEGQATDTVTGRFSDSDSDGLEEDDDPVALPQVGRQAVLPPAPPLPPPPCLGFQNLGTAIQIAVESSEAVRGTASEKNARAAALVRDMLDEGGPRPASSEAAGVGAFAASGALDDVVALVRRAGHGELRLNARARRAPKNTCLRALTGCLRALGKNN